MADILFSKCV